MTQSSKESIPIDKRKWNDIPAFDHVERQPIAWKISKMLTVFVRHRELHREIDGAVHWSSSFPKLRRDFELEGGRIFSDSQWLGRMLTGSNKSRFQFCEDSNNNLLYVRAIQGPRW